MGSTGIPSTEELYIPYMQSFIQEELAAGCSGPAVLGFYGGVENKAGTQGELACAMAEYKMTMEAARRVGRPDIYVGIGSATSTGGVMALFFPGGRERHNTMIPVHIMPEQKLDWTRLVLALFAEQRGLVPWTSAISILGALCRGPEDGSVAQVANLLGQLGYDHGPIATTCGCDLDGSFTGRGAMWSYSGAARASERHIGVPLGAPNQSIAGAGTEMAFYEKAAQTVIYVCSGAAFLWYEGCSLGKVENCTNGLEGRLVAETAVAVSGMKMDKANELFKKILAKYEGQLGSAPQGKMFGELYDINKVQPKGEYLALYKRVKEELARLGVPYR